MRKLCPECDGEPNDPGRFCPADPADECPGCERCENPFHEVRCERCGIVTVDYTQMKYHLQPAHKERPRQPFEYWLEKPCQDYDDPFVEERIREELDK
jgi:hypothetical protein